jgi:hypothetical protein
MSYVALRRRQSIEPSHDEQKLDQERELFSRLSIEDLEEFARDNERLLAKSRTMAQRQRLPPAAATLPGAPIDNMERNTDESAENTGDVDDA